ncbi:hypothetical protein ERJ75_000079200 [Trypanosoma vivax]|nr:hypothetical protein ERJ75_000079200 [Trypanosoma vivax]
MWSFCYRIFLLLFVALCHSVCSSCASASRPVSASDIHTLPAQKCEWWRKKKEIDRPASALRTKLISLRDGISKEYSEYRGELADAWPASQHPNVTAASNKAGEALWKVIQLVDNATRNVVSILLQTKALEAYAVEDDTVIFRCEVLIANEGYTPPENITELYSALAKAKEDLFHSNETKRGYYKSYRRHEKKFSELIQSLNATENAYTLLSQVRKEINTTKQVLVTAKALRDVFDAKVATGCAIERRLNIMKDTFVALGNIARDVVAKESMITAKVLELRAEEGKYGVNGTEVNDTLLAVEAATSAEKEASTALQMVLNATYGSGSKGLHALLGYGDDFKHNVAQCQNATYLDRVVLLHLVGEERTHYYFDFGAWRASADNLWASVTNMTNHTHVNCERLENVSCTDLLAKTNDLIEVLRRSRGSIESKLGEAIAVLEAVREQVILGKAKLNAWLLQEQIRKEKQSALSGEVAGPHESAKDESVAPEADAKPEEKSPQPAAAVVADLDDVVDSAAHANVNDNDDLELDNGVHAELNSRKSSTTIAVAAVASVALVAAAAVALFVVRKRRTTYKEVAHF